MTSGRPAAEVVLGVGVGEVEVDGLLLVGGGVAVVHQREVNGDPVGEAGQLQVPVVPPARVLLAEEQHQQHWDEQHADAAAGVADTFASLCAPKLPPWIVAARIAIGMIVKMRKAVLRRLRLRLG